MVIQCVHNLKKVLVLYVNSMLNHHMRDDLSVIGDDYETIWIEINYHKSKNLLCCCLYRHPPGDITNFNNRISSILQKVQKENKSLLIMGDFNIELSGVPAPVLY